MKNKQNKGFTMVEILISITVISILMIPIVGGIISSLNRSVDAKELQQRNELAQQIMEYAKEDDISNIISNKYFEDIGCYDVDNPVKKINCKYYKDDTGAEKELTYKDPVTSTNKSVFYDEYEVTGSVNLGTRNNKYSYLVQISSQDYAMKQFTSHAKPTYKDGKLTGLYDDPNNASMGVVEDLDYRKVALINGTIANYDAAVTDAFITRKLDILEERSPEMFEQYVNQTYEFNPFNRDRIKRNIIISVANNKADKTKYDITCKLQYIDSSSYILQDGTPMNTALASKNLHVIEYTPYSTTFDHIPNIYLMYNVCLYNGFYSDYDYIIVDTADLDLEEEKEVLVNNKPKKVKTTKEVNIFVVETASKYSEGAADSLAEVETSKLEDEAAADPAKTFDRDAVLAEKKAKFAKRILYDNRNTATGDNRDSVNICLAATYDSIHKDNTGATPGSHIANVNIYHNFDFVMSNDPDDDNYGTAGAISKVNSKNKKLHYVDDTSFGPMPKLYEKNGKAYSEVKCDYIYNTTVSTRDGSKSARIKSIEKAKQESRGLYTVKVWMVEGEVSDINKDADPIISGSKGGIAIDE